MVLRVQEAGLLLRLFFEICPLTFKTVNSLTVSFLINKRTGENRFTVQPETIWFNTILFTAL